MEDKLLVVETNVLTYNILNKKDLNYYHSHSLSLYSIYFLGKDLDPLMSKGHKHPASILISLRKNKKAGQVTFFSDNK
jgi:hypothetical protein